MRRYRARRRAAGLTLRRRWVPGQDVCAPYSDQRLLEARSLALHCVMARKIDRDARLLQRARDNVARWTERAGPQAPRYLAEWRAILQRPWPEIARLITGLEEESFRLRQSSPFAGILTQRERRTIYEAFRA